MNELTTKRLLPFLLAMVMIFGTISPAFAAGFDGSNEPVQKTESELISKNGKLRAKLVVPKRQQVQRRSIGLFGAQAKALAKTPAKAPAFGKTTVKVNIAKHGIGTNPFNFDAVFGNTPDTKVTLLNWDTEETQEATVNKDTQSVTFDNPVTMEDIEDGVYSIEFEGTKVAGKITFEESAPSYDGKTYITTYTLDLYQIRNTDVVVTTKTVGGTVVDNPTTAATNGKIKLTAGTVNATIDIPTGTSATETVKNINTRNKNDINNGLNFTVEGLANGVLVDKTANKVYKPEIKVDPDGLKPTEIKFTEKPIVTETEPKIDDPENPGTEITDTDYVKVTFAQGNHGTIAENKTYYVFKDVEMKATLGAPVVTPNKDWEFTTWDPALATKYDEGKTHVAQYKYTGEDVVPQKPGEDKPDVPSDFVLVEFKAGDHGTLSGTTKYWVNPNKDVTLTAPTVKANTGYEFTGWDTALTGKFTDGQVIKAQYNEKDDVIPGSQEKPDGYVTVTFDLDGKGTSSDELSYHVNPNKDVTLTAPIVKANTGYEFTGWDTALTGKFTDGQVIKAQYTQNASIVANPVQKYDEAKDDQYIEGVLPEGKTLPNGATVELVVKNGENYEKVEVPVTTEGGVIKVDVKNDKIKHGETYYFAITEEGKTTSYSTAHVTIDKQGPNMGTAGEEITLVQDAYGYQVKVSAIAKDDSGILRVYAETDKDGGYYKAEASETTANLTESIQNQLGVEKEFTVTAVDKFGNKTEVTKTAKATKTPIMIKAERPLDGDDFIYVTTDVGASLEIKVIDANKEEVFTMTHTQGKPSEEIKLVVGTDGAFKLTKGQRVKVKGSLEGKEDNTLTIRVR